VHLAGFPRQHRIKANTLPTVLSGDEFGRVNTSKGFHQLCEIGFECARFQQVNACQPRSQYIKELLYRWLPLKEPALSYIFSQFSLTRCLILAPGIRLRHPPSFISEIISPRKFPVNVLPRKFMTPLAPKHNVL
jgi:hypothetical protein